MGHGYGILHMTPFILKLSGLTYRDEELEVTVDRGGPYRLQQANHNLFVGSFSLINIYGSYCSGSVHM